MEAGMPDYLSWDTKTISDFSDENINAIYNRGFVFTRKGAGVMDQTRSVRVNLSEFELSSENKRILRKTESILLQKKSLPLAEYDWKIGKMAKDFYETKFGAGTFSANKIKELCADAKLNNVAENNNPSNNSVAQNFNILFEYSDSGKAVGYCIARETNELVHYSYPFYDLDYKNKNIGMGMMIRAVEYAEKIGKQYIYLGSFQRPGDTYKLQFKGLEWFDKNVWSADTEKLKAEIGTKQNTV